MKLIANSSYGQQILDCGRHTLTKYLSDEKRHAAFDSKLFENLDHVNNPVYKAELAKAQIEHKEPVNVGFFTIQHVKLRILELYYNFFTKFCDLNKFKELENGTDLLYLALFEKQLEDCIRPEMRVERQGLQSNDC